MKVKDKVREFARRYAEECTKQLLASMARVHNDPTADSKAKADMVIRLMANELYGAFSSGGWAAMRFVGVSPDQLMATNTAELAVEWDVFLAEETKP